MGAYDLARVLLLWRHRVITDRWGWEVPSGRIDPGESPEVAAGREVLEETGWAPGPLEHLVSYDPNGISDQRHHLFLARRARQRGQTDATEAERVEWVPVDRLRDLVAAGDMPQGLSRRSCAGSLSAASDRSRASCPVGHSAIA